MDLHYLAKLLLQHDANPLIGPQDVQRQLLSAVDAGRLHSCASVNGVGVAVALDQRLVVARKKQGDESSRTIGGDAVEFASVLEAPESVTCLAWLATPDASQEDCLLLGTSQGFLQLHSASGQLLHRQDVHQAPLVSISVRWGGMGIDPGDLSEDITLCAADAVLRLPCLDVLAVLRWQAGNRDRGWWGLAPSPPSLSITKWTLPYGVGPRSYACNLGSPLPSLYSILTERQAAPKVQLFAAGGSPPFATLEADETKSSGLLSLVSGLATSTAAGLMARAKGGGPRGVSAPDPGASAAASSAGGGGGGRRGGKRAKVPAFPATLAASVWDDKRAVQRVSVSPCGTLAACCDTLGRVLLVDMAHTLVLRLLKGYRDAQASGMANRGLHKVSRGGLHKVAWVVAPAALQGLHGSRQDSRPQQRGEQGQQRGDGAAIHGQLSQPQEQEQEQRGGGKEEDPPPLLQQGEGAAGSRYVLEADGGVGADWEAKWSDADGSGERGGTHEEDGPHWTYGPEEGGGPLRGSQDESAQLQGMDVYAVVYAPRRAVVELWQPHRGVRVAAVRYNCQHGVLLQQPAWRTGRAGDGPAGGMVAKHYKVNSVWLLDYGGLKLVDIMQLLVGKSGLEMPQ